MAVAQEPQNICATLKAMTGSVPQRSLSFRFEGDAGVALVLKDRSQFTPNPETCELDDTLGIDCQWKFQDWETAQRFYETMLAQGRRCLRLAMNDESVGIDPNSTGKWNTVRRATAREQAFQLELIEYLSDHYVELTVDPVEFQRVANDEH